MIQLPKPLILASMSPRRAQLLTQVGLPFQIQTTGVDEVFNGQDPVEFAIDTSYEKAHGVAVSTDNAIIVAADTVVLIDNEILGKPEDREDAIRMLNRLSGRMHEVITGYTIIERPTNTIIKDHALTRVWFRNLDQIEIQTYVASGSPLDKAGSYGIQDDFGAVFVSKIEGCYYNVVGLPLAKVYSDLKRLLNHTEEQ